MSDTKPKLTIRLLAKDTDGRTFGVYAEGVRVNVEPGLEESGPYVDHLAALPLQVETIFTLRVGEYIAWEPDAAEIRPPKGWTS